MQNETYLLTIIWYLSKHITTNTCKKLLLGSEDLEVLKTFSSFDKQRVTLKARHIADALQSLVGNTAKGKATMWIQCCERAIEQNCFQIKQARTVADWYLDIHKSKSLKFRHSYEGRASYFAKSPFGENKYLNMQLKSWARQDLEHLSIRKAQNFVNLNLLSDWTAQQLETNKISYPVSEYVVARWMKEAGFSYEVHKKSYYVDRHKDEDVVSNRKAYLINFF